MSTLLPEQESEIMGLANEQEAFDMIAVREMLEKATAAGKLAVVVLAFGAHRENGCTASEAACYALQDCDIE